MVTPNDEAPVALSHQHCVPYCIEATTHSIIVPIPSRTITVPLDVAVADARSLLGFRNSEVWLCDMFGVGVGTRVRVRMNDRLRIRSSYRQVTKMSHSRWHGRGQGEGEGRTD